LQLLSALELIGIDLSQWSRSTDKFAERLMRPLFRNARATAAARLLRIRDKGRCERQSNYLLGTAKRNFLIALDIARYLLIARGSPTETESLDGLWNAATPKRASKRFIYRSNGHRSGESRTKFLSSRKPSSRHRSRIIDE